MLVGRVGHCPVLGCGVRLFRLQWVCPGGITVCPGGIAAPLLSQPGDSSLLPHGALLYFTL